MLLGNNGNNMEQLVLVHSLLSVFYINHISNKQPHLKVRDIIYIHLQILN